MSVYMRQYLWVKDTPFPRRFFLFFFFLKSLLSSHRWDYIIVKGPSRQSLSLSLQLQLQYPTNILTQGEHSVVGRHHLQRSESS
jgi:hypothetical protein